MSKLSEEDSSDDSSSEFLIPADKIDFTSSFFKDEKINKDNKPKPNFIPMSNDSDDSDEEFDEASTDQVSSAELLTQVLRNLENAKNVSVAGPNNAGGNAVDNFQKNSLQSKEELLSQEINNLLLQGESQASLSKSPDKNNDQSIAEENDIEKAEDDNYVIPKDGINVHLPGENLMFHRNKRKKQDLQVVLKNKINQRIRSTQVLVHKVGLLLNLSYGFYLNSLANDTELLGICLSLVSPKSYPKNNPDLKYLEQFTKWFNGLFVITELHKNEVIDKQTLIQRLKEKKIHNYVELILLYIITVRALGIHGRLVISLRPPHLKPKPDQLFTLSNYNNSAGMSVVKKKEEKSKVSKKGTKKEPVEPSGSKTKQEKTDKKTSNKGKQAEDVISLVPNSPEGKKQALLEAKNRAAAVLKRTSDTKLTKSTSKEKNENDISMDSKVDNDITISRKLRSVSKNIMNNKNEKNNTRKGNQSKNAKPNEKSKSKNPKISDDEFISEEESDADNFSTDEEYVVEKPKQRTANQKNNTSATKKNSSKSKDRKLLSSDDETESENAFNIWVEFYVESEASWISVDVVGKKIHCIADLYKKAAKPVLYVIAWNSLNTIRDVTRRYCPHWLTDTRKKRVDEKWWSETLSSWKEKTNAMTNAEDEQLLQHELEQPLPKTVSECKGHPLYALARHLLKFEGLYPPDAVPLGHLKTGEAIYSRYCVHTLYSRETWVKRARVVKPAQEPYKIVKSMPKYDKLSGMKLKDQPLELFGKWQTSPYVPPEAKDGKVPRNEYGNVDLFKMCMLPKGTVYVNLPALNRTAKKLDIDCAQACVGFKFGCRGALPAFEGYVVCEEYEDILREAWESDQREAKKRAKEKREKRIWGNWRKLIKGLIIREKLALKYGQNNIDEGSLTNSKDEELIPKVEKPVNRRKLLSDDESEDEKRNKKLNSKKSTKFPTFSYKEHRPGNDRPKRNKKLLNLTKSDDDVSSEEGCDSEESFESDDTDIDRNDMSIYSDEEEISDEEFFKNFKKKKDNQKSEIVIGKTKNSSKKMKVSNIKKNLRRRNTTVNYRLDPSDLEESGEDVENISVTAENKSALEGKDFSEHENEDESGLGDEVSFGNNSTANVNNSSELVVKQTQVDRCDKDEKSIKDKAKKTKKNTTKQNNSTDSKNLRSKQKLTLSKDDENEKNLSSGKKAQKQMVHELEERPKRGTRLAAKISKLTDKKARDLGDSESTEKNNSKRNRQPTGSAKKLKV